MNDELMENLLGKIEQLSTDYATLATIKDDAAYKKMAADLKKQGQEFQAEIEQATQKYYPQKDWPEIFWQIKVGAFMFSRGCIKNYEMFISKLALAVIGKFVPSVDDKDIIVTFNLIKFGGLMMVNEAFYLYVPGAHYDEIMTIIKAGIKSILFEAKTFLERQCPGFIEIKNLLASYEEHLANCREGVDAKERQFFIKLNQQMRQVTLPDADEFIKKFVQAFKDFLYDIIGSTSTVLDNAYQKRLAILQATGIIIRQNYTAAYDDDIDSVLNSLAKNFRNNTPVADIKRLCKFYLNA